MKTNLFQRLGPICVFIDSPLRHFRRITTQSAAYRLGNYYRLKLGTKRALKVFSNHAQLARRSFHRIGIWKRRK